MIKIRNLLLGAAFAVQIAAPAVAQQTAAASLEELLETVEGVRVDEEQLFQQRTAEYNAASAQEQPALLQRAQTQRTTLDATSQRLTDQYSTNELRINDLNGQLRAKAAALGLDQVFGLARQAANDVAVTLQQSLITTQFPPAPGEQTRDEFLRSFASARTTPSSAELERLWLEIQREMTASGQVAKYRAPVVEPGGEAVDSEVIRIGPFNATSNGRFLAYLPTLRVLNVLPRQLPAEFMEIGEAFERATSGYARAVVDSNRGVLLAFKGDRARIEEDSDVAELRITEAVLKEVPKLERFQPFLRLAVAAGPLLGLIGTVWGMILTFQSITESGSSDPKLMATGIGQAMIATVLGLGIAIPLLFAGALLNSLSRGLVQILDEQSAGMLAESIEKQRRA